MVALPQFGRQGFGGMNFVTNKVHHFGEMVHFFQYLFGGDCHQLDCQKHSGWCVIVTPREILLARPLLSSTQGDLTALLTEVKDQLQELEVPVKGVISDGEETIGKAVTFVTPSAPHQLCQFHYLKDATKLLYEADRHAKTELKKHLPGIRPIERALEEQSSCENEAIRGYCRAVRAALTDDSRSPLQPSGLKLSDRITQIHDSLARIQEKKDCHQL